VAQLSPPGRVGAGFGWYTFVQGLLAVPAGLLAGWLWEHHGAGHAFATTALLAAIACGILLVTVRSHAGNTVRSHAGNTVRSHANQSPGDTP
jgi:hypothetical protein